MLRSLEVMIPPVAVTVDDAKVEIFEVLKFTFPDGSTRYHVTCRINWRGIKSRIFFVDVKDTKDLKRKLEIELSKMKMLYLIGGKKYVEEVVTK